MFSYQQPAHHNHHGGRSRRQPRQLAANKQQQQQHQQQQQQQQQHQQQHHHYTRQPPRTPVVEQPTLTHFTYTRDFENARGFSAEDDELFCPFHLLTEDDLQSIHSSSSDRSSLSSGSPESSPTQHQLHPTPPSFVLNSINPYAPAGFQSNASSQGPKLHQPLAQRNRNANAIPIINPDTRSSVSPARQLRW